MYEFEKVRGAVKPLEIDTESSSFYTYIRKNIKECHEEDFDGWEYEECKVLNDEWVVNEIKAINGSINDLMLGLVDLYEMQLGA